MIKVNNAGVLDGNRDMESIDSSFTSKLQATNLYVQVFSLDAEGNHAHACTIYPPMYTDNMQYWDLGFLNPASSKFLQFGGMSREPLERKTHMRFFMALLSHLN